MEINTVVDVLWFISLIISSVGLWSLLTVKSIIEKVEEIIYKKEEGYSVNIFDFAYSSKSKISSFLFSVGILTFKNQRLKLVFFISYVVLILLSLLHFLTEIENLTKSMSWIFILLGITAIFMTLTSQKDLKDLLEKEECLKNIEPNKGFNILNKKDF